MRPSICLISKYIGCILVLLVLSTPATAVFDEQRHSSSVEELRRQITQEYKNEFSEHFNPTLDKFTIGTLFSYDEHLSIIAVDNTAVPDEYIETAVLVMWQDHNGIAVKRLTWIPATMHNRSGELRVTSIKKVIDGKDKNDTYAIFVTESVLEVDEENDESHCLIMNQMYLVEFSDIENAINILTKKPVPLGIVHTCDTKPTNTISFESKADTLVLKGIMTLAPEQRFWQGKYTVTSGNLNRTDDISEIRKDMTEADTQALQYFKKRDIKTAVAILRPLIEYSPATALDSQTVPAYNDYAFFLAELMEDEGVALEILEQIVAKFPNRAVAHLNIADLYFTNAKFPDNQKKANNHYNTYVHLMELDNKKSRIPKRVWNRIVK